MNFAALIFLSVMVEGLVTYGSSFCAGGKCQWKMLVSVVLGVVVAFNFKIDIFELFGLGSALPFVSKVLTGIFIGRGSNYVSDFLKTSQSYLDNKKA